MKKCKYCDAELKDRRKSYCNNVCRKKFREEGPKIKSKPPKIQSLSSIAATPPDDPQNVKGMKELKEWRATQDYPTFFEYSPLARQKGDEAEPEVELKAEVEPQKEEAPSSFSSVPSIEPVAIYPHPSYETYEKYRTDPRIWIPGASWIKVLRDVSPGESFDQNLDSANWQPVIDAFDQSLPVIDFASMLRENFGGGHYQIRFLQASRASKMLPSKPPFIMKIPTLERQQNARDKCTSCQSASLRFNSPGRAKNETRRGFANQSYDAG